MTISKKRHIFFRECIKIEIKDRIKAIKKLKMKYKPIILELKGEKN